jgi:hypothetical protein
MSKKKQTHNGQVYLKSYFLYILFCTVLCFLKFIWGGQRERKREKKKTEKMYFSASECVFSGQTVSGTFSSYSSFEIQPHHIATKITATVYRNVSLSGNCSSLQGEMQFLFSG